MRDHGEMLRESWRPEDFLQHREALRAIDVSAELAMVVAPTLVVATDQPGTFELSRDLATAIPNARLHLMTSRWGTWGDERDIDTLLTFLGGEAAGSQATAPVRMPASSVRTVLFTDLVGHTEMMQRLGDARGREVLREHERITREMLTAHNGIEIKTDGDSFMMSFASVASAVECAIALQRAFTAREGEPLNVRIGLNAGEPIAEDGDLFGSAVILASRIAAKAEAGEILVPKTVRGLLSGKGFIFADRGEFLPKGFEGGVRLFEVRWRD